jgi:hypothetical protein
LRDSAAQFLEIRRLDQAITCAEVECALDHVITPRRDTQHRHLTNHGALCSFDKERETVHHGHHQIEEDKARPLSLEKLESCQAVGGGDHLVPCAAEHSPFDLSNIWVVFDDENGSHGNTRRWPSRAITYEEKPAQLCVGTVRQGPPAIC